MPNAPRKNYKGHMLTISLMSLDSEALTLELNMHICFNCPKRIKQLQITDIFILREEAFVWLNLLPFTLIDCAWCQPIPKEKHENIKQSFTSWIICILCKQACLTMLSWQAWWHFLWFGNSHNNAQQLFELSYNLLYIHAEQMRYHTQV